MPQHSTPASSGVEANVARPGGVSYLRIPAHDLAQSAEFYRAVFGWQVRGRPDAPSFSDGTGHVIGHWRTDLPAAGQAGVLPYIYVTSLDAPFARRPDTAPSWSPRPTRKETSG
jgi:predicted enzyme related to lactoylglutathione lyase